MEPLCGGKTAVQMPGKETELPAAAACHDHALSGWSGTSKKGGHKHLLNPWEISLLRLGTYAVLAETVHNTCYTRCKLWHIIMCVTLICKILYTPVHEVL